MLVLRRRIGLAGDDALAPHRPADEANPFGAVGVARVGRRKGQAGPNSARSRSSPRSHR